MEIENNNTILIIAVIYNSYKDTIRYIKNLEKFEERNIKLIFVDNSEINPTTDFETTLKESKLDIEYLKSERNSGYFGGAKIGLEKYLRNNSLPQWVIITNVDIEFNDKDFFKLLENHNEDENIGVIAPSIVSKRMGVDLNPKILTRYSKKKLYLYKFITSSQLIQNSYLMLGYIKKYLKNISRKLKKQKPRENTGSRKIYAPHGSCIILNRNYFEKGATLKHISFLFGEEIFIAENALKYSLDVIYYPELKVLDYEHTSTGFFYSSKISKLMHVSTNDIIETYYK